MASESTRMSLGARLAVGVAVLALPLLGAGSAFGAMAGANPLSSMFRPDLRTVTLVSPNVAQFCFDKTLSQSLPLVPGRFALGGYQSFSFASTSTGAATMPTSVVYDLTNTNCVDATYPPTAPPLGATVDYSQYTYGAVGPGAVQSLSGAQVNDADSTALTGSTTHNGTTGNTVAPDLTGVSVNPTTNTVTYVFNKNIGNTLLGKGSTGKGFFIVDPGGNVCRVNGDDPAGSVVFSGNTVSVTFPKVNTARCPAPFVAGPSSVGNAVRAGVDNFVVQNALAGGERNADFQVVIVPGTSGTTARPDLIQAALGPSGNQVSYTFDQPIGSATAAFFFVDTSDAGFEGGSSATISNTATTGTVTVTFAAGSNFNEYDVKAEVDPGAATGLNSGLGSTLGSAPIGDNAGAFARGFTTGPDAFGVTFNSATGDAVVTFDQRVFPDILPVAAGFVLLDANGTPVAGGAGLSVGFVPAPAGPMQVTVHFNPSAIAVAKALEICGPPTNLVAFRAPTECTTAGATGGSVFTTTTGEGPSAPNVQQILSPFATSSLVHRAGRVVWKHARVVRMSRRERALMARILRAERAHKHRHAHKHRR